MPRIAYIGPGSSARKTEYRKRAKNGVRTRVHWTVKYSDGHKAPDDHEDTEDHKRLSGRFHGEVSDRRIRSHDAPDDRLEQNAFEARAAVLEAHTAALEERATRQPRELEANAGTLATGGTAGSSGKYYADHHDGGRSVHGERQRQRHYSHGHGHRHRNRRWHGYDEYRYPSNIDLGTGRAVRYYPGYFGPHGIIEEGLLGLYAGGGLASRAPMLFQHGARYGMSSAYFPGIGFLPDLGFRANAEFGNYDLEDLAQGNPDGRFLYYAFDPRFVPRNEWGAHERDVVHRYPNCIGYAECVFGRRLGGYPVHSPQYRFDDFAGVFRPLQELPGLLFEDYPQKMFQVGAFGFNPPGLAGWSPPEYPARRYGPGRPSLGGPPPPTPPGIQVL